MGEKQEVHFNIFIASESIFDLSKIVRKDGTKTEYFCNFTTS